MRAPSGCTLQDARYQGYPKANSTKLKANATETNGATTHISSDTVRRVQSMELDSHAAGVPARIQLRQAAGHLMSCQLVWHVGVQRVAGCIADADHGSRERHLG